MISKIEQVQLDILDVLLETGGYWTSGDGNVLASLAQVIHSDDSIAPGDGRYKRTSLAVLRLEASGFLAVERRFTDLPERANIIEGIRLL